MNAHSLVAESHLRQELSHKGFDMQGTPVMQDNGKLEVQANALEPVADDQGDALYATVPVTLWVSVDNHNKIEQIEGGNASPEAIDGARNFVKTLIANNQLDGLKNNPQPRATHQVEINEKGQRVIKRRRIQSLF
ncbi:hypothetical protein QNI19_24160 [Cytophagaceae bacterium DM2B3-1]|uniref:Uncharacterized protein n=1 Tax=Xanthocytophaga flava TaxID=3048013 RepID=A0AAE3QSF7_9BACT|nr:hypothetical protein [Xanthocytophaga flavus]MDJ1484101.1 hypothetical protein [Xanthocytophaga flavus]MDJ1496052.1 hypothetical protein [Xanthocytophaga flavus]